jgi:hypothetical protein
MHRALVLLTLLCGSVNIFAPVSAQTEFGLPGDVDVDGRLTTSDLNFIYYAYLTGDLGFLLRRDLADVEPNPSDDPRGFGDGEIGADDLNRIFRAFTHTEPFPEEGPGPFGIMRSISGGDLDSPFPDLENPLQGLLLNPPAKIWMGHWPLL